MRSWHLVSQVNFNQREVSNVPEMSGYILIALAYFWGGGGLCKFLLVSQVKEL